MSLGLKGNPLEIFASLFTIAETKNTEVPLDQLIDKDVLFLHVMEYY